MLEKQFVKLVHSGADDPEDPEEKIRASMIALSRAGVTPRDIVFEVEEADLARDPEWSARLLRCIRAIKAGFALSNAGVSAGGYSFQAVRDFAPDYIKLDRRLVQNIDQPGDSVLSAAPIISKLVQMSEMSGGQVVADGVDRISHAENLWLLGVRFMQGHLFDDRNG